MDGATSRGVSGPCSNGWRAPGPRYPRSGRDVRHYELRQRLEECGVQLIPTAAQAPNQDVYIERWIRNIKDECLRHFIVFGQQHFDFLVTSYVDFYNTLRPHQGFGNRPLLAAVCRAEDAIHALHVVTHYLAYGDATAWMREDDWLRR